MSCIRLYTGQDISCLPIQKKYYQQVVLVNKSDVSTWVVDSRTPQEEMPFPTLSNYAHRIRFSLKPGKTGFLFQGLQNGNGYFAIFSKEIDENIPQYSHTIQLPIFGVSESTKLILKTLDYAQYFAAIQYTDGTVEIYGFENGLTTDDYDYDPQNNGGGSFINLISPENGMEDEPPFIYVPLTGTANEDFNNLFVDIEDIELGSFNDDFNNDFDITL